jgi:outer membrane protein TolC
MGHLPGTIARLAVAAGLALPVGCAVAPADPLPPPRTVPDIRPVAYTPAEPQPVLFDGLTELSADRVTAEVLARNPTLAQMAAAVRAAEARYPQVTSPDDPTLSAAMAPATIGIGDGRNYSQRVELAQKVPYPGKLRLRGESASANAAAAGQDLDDARLQLVEAARAAYFDYFLAERSLEVNREGLDRLAEFKRNAETRYKTGQVPQQDVLQADVETGRQTERRFALERARTVAVARLNTLMNRPADAPLPPPANDPPPLTELPEVSALRDAALARRPDLKALAARIDADRAALDLAHKEFYPDVEFMAAYDTFWQAADRQQPLRPQLGLRTNLPVQLTRRRAAVAEAEAVLAQRQAAFARLTNEVGFEVQQAHAQVREAEQSLRLYDEKILPAARENVKAAQSAYVTGKVPFVTLVEAQRSLVELKERAYAAAADYHRRRAGLERAVGGPPDANRR